MDWRTWLFSRLTSQSLVTDLVPAEQIKGAGSIEEPPAVKPFIVIVLGPKSSDAVIAHTQEATIWVHDVPGGYTRIDEILAAVRTVLEVPVTDDDGIIASWQGDSNDFADDQFKTITKNASFRLAGRG